MQKVELFHLVAGLVLSRLYDEFPLAADLKDSDLPGPLAEAMGVDRSSWLDMFHATMGWLKEEGFLAMGPESREGAYFRVKLAGRGIHSLSLPEPSSRMRTIGEHLVEAAAKGQFATLEHDAESALQFISFRAAI